MAFPRRAIDWRRTPFGIFKDPRFRKQGRWILLAALVGAVSGGGAIVFDLMFRFAQRVLLEGIGGFRPPPAGSEGLPGFGPGSPWLPILSLVVGGLIAGALVFGLAPETEGHGTDEVIRSFHHLRGKIRRRVPFVKAISSAVNIGSGGSAGREGPIAQIGAGFGSFLGDLLKVSNHDRRILVMAGVAGGIGSIFRAPFGASLFAAEVLYTEPEFEYEILMPGLISSITGYSIYSSYAGWRPLFDVPKISFHQPGQLIVFLGLGLVCALAGRVYPPTFYGIRDRFFRRLPVPPWTKPALGAALLGVLAIWFPEVLGMGYGYIQETIDGKHDVGFLLTFAALKIVATSLTLSSGGSGGVFGPSLVIGGALGGAVGMIEAPFLADFAPNPVACVMVGMCGFFAGVAKTPLAAVIMVMEMTGSYGLLVPSLLVAAIAYLALPLGVKIYENQLTSRSESPAHLGSFAIDVLALGTVGESYQPLSDRRRALAENVSLREMVDLAGEAAQSVFPVVDREGRLRGAISIENIRQALLEDVPHDLVVAADLMLPVDVPLVCDDDLATAARLLAEHVNESLPVVDDRESRRVIGIFGRRDLIVGYGAQSDKLRDQASAHASSD